MFNNLETSELIQPTSRCLTNSSQILLSRSITTSNTVQLQQLPFLPGGKTSLQENNFKNNEVELRRCSLSSPCLLPSDENSSPSSVDLRTSGGKDIQCVPINMGI